MTDETKRALLEAEFHKPCPDPDQPTHLLGSEPFWCLTCNGFLEDHTDELERLGIIRCVSADDVLQEAEGIHIGTMSRLKS
jgi:hypothetical protein